MSAAFRKRLLPLLCAVTLAPGITLAASEAGLYQTRADFLLEAFGTERPESAVVWLDDDLRSAVAQVLEHAPAMLRIRYWYGGESTAWIIDEIGKEKAITFGVVVENGEIRMLRVMQFRETRGWEIRYPFFTRQFARVRLTDAHSLSHRIDGITGATLSVKAATRVATLALVLDEYTRR